MCISCEFSLSRKKSVLQRHSGCYLPLSEGTRTLVSLFCFAVMFDLSTYSYFLSSSFSLVYLYTCLAYTLLAFTRLLFLHLFMISILSFQGDSLVLLSWCSFFISHLPSFICSVPFPFLFLGSVLLDPLQLLTSGRSISFLVWVFHYTFFCFSGINFFQSHERFGIVSSSFINSLISFICEIGTTVPNFHKCYGYQISWPMQSIEHNIK